MTRYAVAQLLILEHLHRIKVFRPPSSFIPRSAYIDIYLNLQMLNVIGYKNWNIKQKANVTLEQRIQQTKVFLCFVLMEV